MSLLIPVFADTGCVFDEGRIVTEHKNPNRGQLEALLQKHDAFFTPKLRSILRRDIARMDDTDPRAVIARLPPEVATKFREALVYSASLVALLGRARAAEAWVEVLVLSHNLIKLSLRLLYVLAWQRTVDRSLSTDELLPYFDGYEPKADVYLLVGTLRKGKLLEKPQARLLWTVNDWRNDAVHGLVFGQIPYDTLKDRAERAIHAATGALDRTRGWLNNPKPLQHFVDEGPA